MQLIEFFLWRNLNDKEWNYLFSFMASVLLAIHPLAFCLIITNSVIQKWFIGLYILFLFTILYIHETGKVDYSVNVANNGHLIWNWAKSYFPSYCLYLIFFFALWIEKYYSVFIIILATYIYSIISYYYEGTFNSMWCWTANIISVFILLHIFFRFYASYRN